MRKILLFAICALAVLSCTEKSPEIKRNVCSVETGEAYDITPFSAKLLAQFNMGSFMVDVNTRTVYCSADPNPGKDNCVTFYYEGWEAGKNYWYYYGLEPNTTYYYRAYLDYEYLSESETLLGKVKSFTTQAIEGDMVTTLDPEFRSGSHAFIRGSIPDAIKNAGDFSVWFEWGKIDSQTKERCSPERNEGTWYDDGTFGYETGTECGYCRAGVTFRGKEYIGEEKTWFYNQ